LKNPWLAWLDAATFAAETQWVVALRMSRLAAGGAQAAGEANRMISEKLLAGAQAQLAAGMALATGRGMEGAARAAAHPFRRAVRANRRRLTRS
jgi:hypothetical protein